MTGKQERQDLKAAAPSRANDGNGERRLVIHAALDTSCLRGGSAVEVFSKSCEEAVRRFSGDSSVEVIWHIPKTVLAERTYQIYKEGVDKAPRVAFMHRVMGIKRDLSEGAIKAAALGFCKKEIAALGLIVIEPDYAQCSLKQIAEDAVWRRAPFEDVAKNEKGFRDALILEEFSQLLEGLDGSSVIALVAGDAKLREAAEQRWAERENFRVFESVLKAVEFISFHASDIEEEFAEEISAIAKDRFFVEGEENTLWVSENLEDRIESDNRIKLAPVGLHKPSVDSMTIHDPIFLSKHGQRWTWRTPVVVSQQSIAESPTVEIGDKTGWYTDFVSPNWLKTTQRDVIANVTWSAEVSLGRTLSEPTIDDIAYEFGEWHESEPGYYTVTAPRRISPF